MNLNETVTIPPQVMVRQIGEEIVILDLANGTYFGLNPVGAHIWQFLSQGKTLAETCAEMLNKYDVLPIELERDVINLTNELLSKKLINLH
jgi:Coenzyme PQQ synthesis protein D (PqqD)